MVLGRPPFRTCTYIPLQTATARATNIFDSRLIASRTASDEKLRRMNMYNKTIFQHGRLQILSPAPL